MRTLDYMHLPSSLFEREVGDLNARLFEDKGRLDMLEQLHAPKLQGMCKQAHLNNVDASARIEGLCVQPSRISELVRCALDGAPIETLEGLESQIVGYSRVLRSIDRDFSHMELSTSTILSFYETLFSARDFGLGSRYRSRDYMFTQVDGQTRAVAVSPISAFETPLVLGGACDSLAGAFDENSCSSLILACVFTVDFLCIRPFDEGNGRVARLVAELLLRKAGFNVARYVGIDKIIEASAEDYYDSLNACVKGWDVGKNDYAPFARYWLSVLHEAYEQLFSRANLLLNPNNSKTDQVRLVLEMSDEPLSKRDIMAALPDVSIQTVEKALGALVKEGAVSKLGAGRATAYCMCANDPEESPAKFS